MQKVSILRRRTDDSSTAVVASDQVVTLGGRATAPAASARVTASREVKENIFVEGGRKQEILLKLR